DGEKSKKNTKVDERTKEIEEGTKLADNEEALKAAIGEEKFNELKESGNAPSIHLDVKRLKDVSDTVKDLVKTGMGMYSSSIPNLAVGDYLDITLEVNEEGTWEKVTKTNGNVQIVIPVAKQLLAKSDTFYVLRLHEGEATLLYDVDEEPETVTINTDGFSTYVMLYQEKEEEETEAAADTGNTEKPEEAPVTVTEKAPDTGAGTAAVTENTGGGDNDMWRIWVFGLLVVLIVGLIIVCIKGPKMFNKG
ncbi:MAG: hypothetical protein K6F87_07860, partial [Lachnospiraceae bacterium]|nr:hypothetical protein [Lachnospiraceae bacterium]